MGAKGKTECCQVLHHLAALIAGVYGQLLHFDLNLLIWQTAQASQLCFDPNRLLTW